MSDKHDKHGSEKGLLARTATYTTKKARRTTTKLKQRVGKGDETKDEVFDEFVANFHKQQAAAARLTSELRNYLRCITAMQVAASTFGEAVKDVYDNEWTGKESITQQLQEADSNWTCLSGRLTDEVLEPLTSYQKPFAEVKNKIHKRSRKLVDYDHSRHAVDTLRAKGATKSSDAKKLNLAEEEYQKAKDVFIDLTSELYEELPALYDSRIGFYVSCFQSIFTLEEVFHREASNNRHSLNDIMDQLIKDFSAGTYSTRKPFSAGMETTGNSSEKEESDSKLSGGNLAQFYDVAVPDTTVPESAVPESAESTDTNSSQLENVDCVDSPPDEDNKELVNDNEYSVSNNSEDSVPVQPSRPAPRPPPPKLRTTPDNDAASDTPPTKLKSASTPPSRPKPPSAKSPSVENTSKNLSDNSSHHEEPQNIHSKEGDMPAANTDTNLDSNDKVALESDGTMGEVDENTQKAEVQSNVIAYQNTKTGSHPYNLTVPSCLYLVQATHQYTPEDEDELSFDKGEVIHVIPYDDPDEQDDGWLMGVLDSTGLVGVFPENFTKRMSVIPEK